MKTAIKLALAGMALVGAAAANAAPIANLPGTGSVTNGSDLVLFAKDYDTNSYFTVDLGTQVGSLYSLSQVITDGPLTSPGSFTSPTSFDPAATTAFQTWLSSQASTSNVKWSILASQRSGTGAALGTQSAFFTSTASLGTSSSHPTNANVTTFASNANTFFTNMNAVSGNVSGTKGWDGDTASDGSLADTGWGVSLFTNGAQLGTSQTMFLFANNSSTGSAAANLYVGASVMLDASGLHVTNAETPPPPVPLPAAVWLLGSGLLGMLGIGRRRAVKAA